MNKNDKIFSKEKVLLLLPFIAWVISFIPFYSKKFMLSGDGPSYLNQARYFLYNISRGVYPLWNPFYSWGRTDDWHVRLFGELNPFLHAVIIFNKLGISFLTSYFMYIALYFVVGAIGFYLLAKRVLHDKWAAYIAVTLLLFSSLGYGALNGIAIILIFVPMVWFFYFLVAFTQTSDRIFFSGLTFVLMVIATTYLPFHLATVFITFAICFCILFYRNVGSILKSYFKFITGHKLLVLFCIAAFALSLFPGMLWYQAGNSGDYIFSWRHKGSNEEQVAGMAIEAINAGGVIGPYTLSGLFSNLSDIKKGGFYIPIFAYIMLLLGIISPINKKLVLLLSGSFFIFLISLTSVTPVHRFLYGHIFFFKLFRNLHYLVWLVLPAIILFIVEQFRFLLNYSAKNKKGNILITLYSAIVHFGFAVFLFHQENVIISSYIVIGLSFLFFTFYFFGHLKGKKMLCAFILFVLILIQPIEVFYYMHENPMDFVASYTDEIDRNDQLNPIFSFTRPKKGELPPIKEISITYADNKDTSGFISIFQGIKKYIGLKWSYFLHENVDHDILQDYVRHKFVVYDQVKAVNQDELDLKELKAIFTERRNVALVMDEDPSETRIKTSEISKHPQIINEDSEEFQMLKFDLNYLKFKTNFKEEKFVVYNDSFYKGWMAFVNGKPAKIFRANVAFKGLWLPSGENIVYLRYRSQWRHFFHIFLMVFFNLFLFYLLYKYVRDYVLKKTALTN